MEILILIEKLVFHPELFPTKIVIAIGMVSPGFSFCITLAFLNVNWSLLDEILNVSVKLLVMLGVYTLLEICAAICDLLIV